MTDLGGYLHCVDLKNGKGNWVADQLSGIWSSPAIAGDHVLTMNEDGEVNVFLASADSAAATPVATIPNVNFDSYYANAVIENGVIYFVTRKKLIVVEDPETGNALQ